MRHKVPHTHDKCICSPFCNTYIGTAPFHSLRASLSPLHTCHSRLGTTLVLSSCEQGVNKATSVQFCTQCSKNCHWLLSRLPTGNVRPFGQELGRRQICLRKSSLSNELCKQEPRRAACSASQSKLHSRALGLSQVHRLSMVNRLLFLKGREGMVEHAN